MNAPLRHLSMTAWTDILESLRARWFTVYTLVFGSLVVLLFVLGLTESRVMGFTGLSRLMLTYIQLSMAILPITRDSVSPRTNSSTTRLPNTRV